jgi:hypothetical protein
MATQQKSTLRCLILAVALTQTAFAADSGTVEFIHCLGGTPQTLKHSDTNAANIVMMVGNLRTPVAGGLLDNTASQCTVLNGMLNGTLFAHGVCEFTDLDNDRLFIEFERKQNEGTFHSINGTGKYQNLALDGTYNHAKFPQRAGYFQGCAESKGKWRKQ